MIWHQSLSGLTCKWPESGSPCLQSCSPPPCGLKSDLKKPGIKHTTLANPVFCVSGCCPCIAADTTWISRVHCSFGSHTRWGGKVDMSGKNMTIKSHSTTFRSVRPVLSFSFVFCKRVWDQTQTRLNSCPSSEWLTASSLPIETRAEVFPKSRSKIVNLECV